MSNGELGLCTPVPWALGALNWQTAPSEIWVRVAILIHRFRGVGRGEASEKAERGGGVDLRGEV